MSITMIKITLDSWKTWSCKAKSYFQKCWLTFSFCLW